MPWDWISEEWRWTITMIPGAIIATIVVVRWRRRRERELAHLTPEERQAIDEMWAPEGSEFEYGSKAFWRERARKRRR